MKLQSSIILFLSLFILSCSNTSNSSEFIEQTTGRYLYNSNDIIEIFYIDNHLHMKWLGAKKLKPMKLKDNTFFVKEMNEKIQFLVQDNVQYISLIPKEKDMPITYDFRKMEENEKIPKDYLKNKEWDKALVAYLDIQKRDSTDLVLNEYNLNKLGYKKIHDNKEEAIAIFKINVALYPKSSNVYDSLGEALLQNRDTIQALDNFKKSLELDPNNRSAERFIKRIEKKE